MKKILIKGKKDKKLLAFIVIAELIIASFLGVYVFRTVDANVKVTTQVEAEEKAARQKAADKAAVNSLYTDSDSALVRTAVKYVGNRGGEIFWKWYGYDYHVAWCGCFVSYCANANGYLGTDVPKFSYVPTGVSWFMSKGEFKYPSQYTPESGDIIFFRAKGSHGTGSGAGAHVGIVAGAYKGKVYTIEGNHYDVCAKRSYSLKSSLILGYGTVPSD